MDKKLNFLFWMIVSKKRKDEKREFADDGLRFRRYFFIKVPEAKIN